MLKVLAWLVCCVTLNAALSSELRRLPPVPPAPIKVALTNLQAAIRTLVVLDVSTAIQSSGGEAENVAYHFRAIAGVFAAMPTNGTFSVEHLKAELDKTPSPLNVDLSQVRASIILLYQRAYEYRQRAELPPLEWLSKISDTFADAIRDGIKQGGKEHIL